MKWLGLSFNTCSERLAVGVHELITHGGRILFGGSSDVVLKNPSCSKATLNALGSISERPDCEGCSRVGFRVSSAIRKSCAASKFLNCWCRCQLICDTVFGKSFCICMVWFVVSKAVGIILSRSYRMTKFKFLLYADTYAKMRLRSMKSMPSQSKMYSP